VPGELLLARIIAAGIKGMGLPGVAPKWRATDGSLSRGWQT